MFETIVWATDGSAAADYALPYAKTLAEENQAKLVVVHVKELMIGRAGGYPVFADEEELEAKIRRQADELREDGIDVRFDLLTAAGAHAAHLIAGAAGEVGADVIVVGTRGHGPVAGLLLGSVTQRLLHIAPCPVFAVPGRNRPEQSERTQETAAVV